MTGSDAVEALFLVWNVNLIIQKNSFSTIHNKRLIVLYSFVSFRIFSDVRGVYLSLKCRLPSLLQFEIQHPFKPILLRYRPFLVRQYLLTESFSMLVQGPKVSSGGRNNTGEPGIKSS